MTKEKREAYELGRIVGSLEVKMSKYLARARRKRKIFTRCRTQLINIISIMFMFAMFLIMVEFVIILDYAVFTNMYTLKLYLKENGRLLLNVFLAWSGLTIISSITMLLMCYYYRTLYRNLLKQYRVYEDSYREYIKKKVETL